MTKSKEKKQVKRDEKGQFAKGTKMKAGPGRPKKIKSTGRPFEDLILAYEQLGGITELVRWANQNNANKMEFYRLLMRTIPKEVIEKLLMRDHVKEDWPRIEYVSINLERQRLRIQQLEEFIRKQGAVVPEPAEIRQSGADTGENGEL
ncbi:hypothetical protein ES707_06721 [subsurface metagenome]